MDIKLVGVVGTGVMGSGIARACAQAGYYGRKVGKGFYDYR